MEILQEKQNILLKRREVKIVVEAEKNPGMQEASKIISEQFKTPEENLKVSKIAGKFGRNTFLINANIYGNKEDKEKTELKTKQGKEADKKAAEDKKLADDKRVAEENKPKENKEGDKK